LPFPDSVVLRLHPGCGSQDHTVMRVPGIGNATLLPHLPFSSAASFERPGSSPCTRHTGGCPAIPPYHVDKPSLSAWADNPPTVCTCAHRNVVAEQAHV